MIGALIGVLLQATVPFATIAQGTDSHLMELREAVVRSADEWQMLWRDHSTRPVPIVDFSRVVVVGVFLGSRSTAGYLVEIVSVTTEGATTTIGYRERRPPAGAVAAQVLTAPYHLVSVSRAVNRIEFRNIERAP